MKKKYRYKKIVRDDCTYYDMIDDVKVVDNKNVIDYYIVKSSNSHFAVWEINNGDPPEASISYITSTRVSYDMFRASPEISIEIIEHEEEKNV